jgi:indole-3-glycerol phosphate synthase
LIVAESGLETPADIRRLYRAGARAFLIGESLLREGNPLSALSLLTHPLDASSSEDQTR